MMGVWKISADVYCVCLVMGTGVGCLVLPGGSVLYLSVCISRRLAPSAKVDYSLTAASKNCTVKSGRL